MKRLGKIAIAFLMVTTNIGAVAVGLMAMIFTWVYNGKPSLPMICNGILAGLVSVTAGCDTITISEALTIGGIASLMVYISVNFIYKVLKIDDPVGAISVHGVGGFILFGTIKATVGLRVEKRIEEKGLDIYEHGGSAYGA